GLIDGESSAVENFQRKATQRKKFYNKSSGRGYVRSKQKTQKKEAVFNRFPVSVSIRLDYLLM
ncbi:MAG: hypothetical protein VXA39_13420, partial [Deltaproteobacteria bacterium]